MLALAGYELAVCLARDVRTALYRGVRTHDERPVLVKLLTAQSPSARDVARLRHERDVLVRLEGDAVLHPLELAQQGERAALVYDDPGGTSLSQLQLEGPLELGRALEIAVGLAWSLTHVHDAGVIHRHLTPASVFVGAGQVRLHDFGVASMLSREAQSGLDVLEEGALAYMAPEQTGRMNRAVDYRADFYALGVTLYELMTGRLPFEASDPMGWVHCHIARQPRVPHAVNAKLPPQLSALLLRLLAKTAEARYQSARGLCADLERCHAQWREQGRIDTFALGAHDVTDRFQLPEALYGREQAVGQLVASCDRAASGEVGLLLVEGPAGVGKSALIQEAQRPLSSMQGFFLRGKFDQAQRQLPYASLVQALRGLVQQILMEPAAVVARWREALEVSLGEHLRVVCSVLPELELIVGGQPAPAPVGVSEEQNRFNLAFQRFVRVFCQPGRPLALFLDDVQWADQASLGLIQALLSDPDASHLLVILSLRSEEVGQLVGWEGWLGAVQRAGRAQVSQLRVDELTEAEVAQLIGATLHAQAAEVMGLARVVVHKTGGNPFFVRELLTALWEGGQITWSREAAAWRWDLDAVRRAALTENVVELLTHRIRRLEPQAQQFLQVGACIGAQFELDVLARVVGSSAAEVARALWPALEEGLIAPDGEGYRYAGQGSEGDASDDAPSMGVRYHFQHDRVQQAAYAMLEAAQASELHLRIGRRMVASYDTFDRHERLFDVVSQLNQGVSLIEDGAERLGLAQLNLTASRRARASMAYEFARQCALRGLECLGARAWESQYEMTWALSLIRAECEYLLGNFELAERLFAAVRVRCLSDLERARVLTNQVELYGHMSRHLEAVSLGLEGLKLLDVDVPAAPTTATILQEVGRARWRRGRRQIAALSQLPEIDDPRVEAAMALIVTMAASANFTSQTLFPTLALRMLSISLKRGHSPVSSFAYCAFGLISGSVLGDFQAGREFGLLSLRLGERYAAQEPRTRVRNLFIFGGLINHWTTHAREDVPYLEQAVRLGLECGDFVYAGYGVTILLDALIYTGAPLTRVLTRTASGLEVLARVRDDDSTRMGLSTRQLALALTGQTSELCVMDGEGLDEQAHVSAMRGAVNQNPTALHQLYRLILATMAGRPELALEIAQASSRHPEGTLGMLLVPEHMFYHALAILAVSERATGPERARLTPTLLNLWRKLRGWATTGPQNFAPRLAILDAELARVRGKDAQRRYEHAISLARAQGFTQLEGLANELAARYHEQAQQSPVAQVYWRQAIDAYTRWGASAVLERLRREQPGAFEHSAPQEGEVVERVGMVASRALDLDTVLKATRALSSEIQLDRLLQRLMRIALESAGAQRGAIVLRARDGGEALTLNALGDAQHDEVRVLDRAEPLSDTHVSVGIVTYVARTGQSVVLEDASREELFASDAYVRQHKPRSVLCMPLSHQGELVGVLYLENNLATGAFTEARLEVLRVLSTQLAISLENARMYDEVERARQTLEARVSERTRALEAANKELHNAQQLAVDASYSKSLFLANMSHELRTPLNAILGYSELLREDMQDEGIEAYVPDLEKILIAARHLLALINDILDLSKIEARKMDVLWEQVDVERLVHEVATTVEPLMERNQNRFALKLRDPGRLEIDSTKLRQVLVNLLSNASKFTDRGEVVLEAWRETRDDGEAWRMFAIRDTGIGISPQQLERLFEAFSQASADTSQRFGGTGLGLALSRELCRLMGGDITVESQPGLGSTFTVALPQRRELPRSGSFSQRGSAQLDA